MRVSNAMNYDQVKTNIQRNRSEMAELQNQAATQKRITKPSDDPVGAARTLGLRTDKAGTEQFLRNLEMGRTFMNYTESSLGDLAGVVSRLKELAISQASEASSNATTRLATAAEVDQLFKDVVGISNRKIGERYLFGGFKTTAAPFDAQGKFLGDDGNIQLEVSKGVYANINLSGDKVFLGNDPSFGRIPEDRRGSNTPNYPAAPHADPTEPPPSAEDVVNIRGPASIYEHEKAQQTRNQELHSEGFGGENIFNIIQTLSAGLRSNDTAAIQSTLERFDTALNQAVLLRSQVGSRSASLDNTYEGLLKGRLDDSALLSSIEDADSFEVFSDITRNENMLKATMQTSGKLIQPSLLDFLR